MTKSNQFSRFICTKTAPSGKTKLTFRNKKKPGNITNSKIEQNRTCYSKKKQKKKNKKGKEHVRYRYLTE